MRSSSGWAHRKTLALKGKRGMTLIEVMVAALILLVAMAGIVPLFVTGLSQASTIRLRSIATNVARDKMERIRQLDYREIYTDAMKATDTSLGNRTLENLFGTTETVRNSTFIVSYSVNNQSYQEGTLKEVTVDVTWSAPSQVSPASVTTLVHQQFLGPRGSSMVISPTTPDPLGTPFALVDGTTTVRYYIAQADWALIYYDLNAASPTARNVYMRIGLFDDHGQSIPVGPSGTDYKIDTSYLQFSKDADGAVDAVWFEFTFDADTIPDGYWMTRGVAYNEYNEPGNTWRLRVRVEQGAPSAPTGLVATPQTDNHTIVLNWLSGDERDREHWVLERRKWDYATDSWFPWVTVVSELDPQVTTYTDVGNLGSGLDPWGNASTHNYYEYSLRAVDICDPGNTGPAALVQTYMPDLSTTTTEAVATTTTSSTIPTSTTTTTAALVTVTIQNNSGNGYTIVIKDEALNTVYSGTVKKNRTLSVSGMTSGNAYRITATTTTKTGTIITLYGDFVAGQTQNPVMAIS